MPTMLLKRYSDLLVCDILFCLHARISRQHLNIDGLIWYIGALAGIGGDLVDLRTFIEENREPAIEILLNLKRDKILELWGELATQGRI